MSAAVHDGHIHLTSGDVDVRAHSDALLADLDAVGVARAAVVTPSTMGWDNSVTFEALAAHPDRFVAIARVDLNATTGIDDLADVLDRGAAGIRLTLLGATAPPPLAGPVAAAAVALLAAHRAVAEFHCAPEQLDDVGRFARAHPEVTVLIDHLGRPEAGGLGGSAHQAFLALAELSNVCAKTPGLGFFSREPYPHRDIAPFLNTAVDRFGPDRLLWGSDWPGCLEFGPYSNTLDGARAALADRTEGERAAVLGGTFERLLLDR